MRLFCTTLAFTNEGLNCVPTSILTSLWTPLPPTPIYCIISYLLSYEHCPPILALNTPTPSCSWSLQKQFRESIASKQDPSAWLGHPQQVLHNSSSTYKTHTSSPPSTTLPFYQIHPICSSLLFTKFNCTYSIELPIYGIVDFLVLHFSALLCSFQPNLKFYLKKVLKCILFNAYSTFNSWGPMSFPLSFSCSL